MMHTCTCIPYVVGKEHDYSPIYLTAVIKLLGRKFQMFGQTDFKQNLTKQKYFLKHIISYLITCFRKFYDL